MSFKAPIEIWDSILKFSISVPLFLDPDPVSTYGVDILRKYSYEAPYWDSERTRNSLRRVCRGWNYTLEGYSHRFIRLYDVVHGRVPITALPFAIRLDLDDSFGCKCDELCLAGAREVWKKIEYIWVSAPFSSEKEAQAAQIAWKVEIIKGWIPNAVGYLGILKQRTPKLKAMLSQALDNVASSVDLPPDLRLFLTDPSEPGERLDIRGMKSITTLHIALESLEGRIERGTLPCLRHLSIDFVENGGAPLLQQDIHNFLEHVGSQLQTFHLRDFLKSAPIQQNLWKVLPNVNRIQLPYSWGECNFPLHHPLQTIQISVLGIWTACRGIRNVEDQGNSFLPLSSENRWTIRMDTTWGEELLHKPSRSASAVSFDEYYKTRMVPFVDSNGESFAQYIVFLITAFWKQPGRAYGIRLGRSDYTVRHF